MVPMGGISMSADAGRPYSNAPQNRNNVARPRRLIGLLYRGNPEVDRVFRRSELRCLRLACGRGEPSRMDVVELGVRGLRGRDQFRIRAIGDVDPADVVVLAVAPPGRGLVYPLVPVRADDGGMLCGVLDIVGIRDTAFGLVHGLHEA